MVCLNLTFNGLQVCGIGDDRGAFSRALTALQTVLLYIMLKSAEGHAKTKKGLPKNFFSEQSLTLLDCKCKLCHVINAVGRVDSSEEYDGYHNAYKAAEGLVEHLDNLLLVSIDMDCAALVK